MSVYAASRQRQQIADRLDPRRTALIVVDMQNDFCAPGGYIERLGMDVGAYPRILPPIRNLLTAARASGAMVIWLVACYEDALIPPSMAVKKQAMGVTTTCCARGSWGAEFFGLERLAAEPLVEKHTFSGFSNPQLSSLLETAAIESLVFCGVQTNVCVETTLRDAHARGYYVTLISDAVASHTRPLHDATLANVRFLIGDVLESDELVKLWSVILPQPANKHHGS